MAQKAKKRLIGFCNKTGAAHQKAKSVAERASICDKQIGFAELVISIIRAIHQENSYCAGVSSESQKEKELQGEISSSQAGGWRVDVGMELTEVLCVTLELSRV